jgi:hypothetical protein
MCGAARLRTVSRLFDIIGHKSAPGRGSLSNETPIFQRMKEESKGFCVPRS